MLRLSGKIFEFSDMKKKLASVAYISSEFIIMSVHLFAAGTSQLRQNSLTAIYKSASLTSASSTYDSSSLYLAVSV